MPHPLRFESKKGRICVAWVWNREGTEKLVNGKQHSVWFVPTGMKGLPQNVLLNFRLEFPKSDLTIYLPSGISEIFRQMVSTLGLTFSHRPRDPKRFGREEKWGLRTRHAQSHASFTNWRKKNGGKRGERYCYLFCPRKRLLKRGLN